MTPATPFASEFKLARQFQRDGNLPKARQVIESVLRAEPNNIEAMLLAAELYAPDSPHVAFKIYTRLAQIAPQRPEAPAGLAWLYHNQGDTPHSDQCLDAAIELDPEYLRTRYYADMAAAVRLIITQGEGARTQVMDFYDSIAAAYQRAVKRYPDSPLTAFNLGRILFVLGEVELAGQAYQRCLALDGEMTAAYGCMVEISFMLEQYEQAIEWGNMIEGHSWLVNGDANDPEWMTARTAAGDLSLGRVYCIQAKAYLWMGQFELMAQTIRRAAETEPWISDDLYRDILDEHVKLSKALLENKQTIEAMNVLEAGHDIARRMKYHQLFLWLAEAYLAHALALHEAKDRKKAEIWLAQASELVKHPPVPVPPQAGAAWNNLKSRLTLGKTSPLDFLRK